MNEPISVEGTSLHRDTLAAPSMAPPAGASAVASTGQWWDPRPRRFTRSQRAVTTILFGGLTDLHDALFEAALTAHGYRAKALPCPDLESLRYGKEFCNRGECNPTYFTVGNLIKQLVRLRDEDGLSPAEIAGRYLFVTISGCGPCRFGMYATEYRKALRDAGFDGFRVLDFKQEKWPASEAESAGLEVTAGMMLTGIKCVVAADVINLMACRIRPYERRPGATDEATARCRKILRAAIRERRPVLWALRRCRARFAAVDVDWLQPKPKVALIGEFWAMTTEGEGNYRMQRFLEAQGAECAIQPLTNWVLYDLWCFRNDIEQRLLLKHGRHGRHRSEPASPLKVLWQLRALELLVKGLFRAAGRAVGLRDHGPADMDELARVADRYYPNRLRGGEGHVEVGEVLRAVDKGTAHLVLSVKPFGCMPSSAVSDGIQSLVTTRFPEANFLPIETTGDGAVNVQSRVQMALFRARAKAREEFAAAGAETAKKSRSARTRSRRRRRPPMALRYPAHRVACTAANALYEA